MLKSSSYDYIFLGAGCASLSLLMRMILSQKFDNKKILLFDKEPKTKNDRTWCFWEKEDGFFEKIVYKSWDSISFLSDDFSSSMNIAPYKYKMIRGIDFYNYCFDEIKNRSNIEVVYSHINSAYYHKEGITIYTDDKTIQLEGATVFNSFFNKEKEMVVPSKEINLLQHFKGWVIETPVPAFDPAKAIFMDFRVHQQRGTTFAYVLPFSATKALVEYTLFTGNILKQEEYETELKYYIDNFLKISSYKISEEEFGVIPMTTRRFDFYSNFVYHIGTVGGQTKASSGYTFRFIQKQADQVLDYLIRDKALFEIPATSNRFHFYDRVLLDVLYKERASGKKIFSQLFKKNKPQQVLKFLDNESSLIDELKIISSLPTLPFLKAALHQF